MNSTGRVSAPQAAHPCVRTSNVLLGLFVCWQLFFLFAANFIRFADFIRPKCKDSAFVDAWAPNWVRKQGHVHDLMETIGGLSNRWAQLTGQLQEWSLFAPGVTDRIPFVAVELRWEDDPAGAAAIARHVNMLASADGWQRLASALLLRSGDAVRPPEVLASENQPADIQHYFRIGKFRLRRFEANLSADIALEEGQTIVEASEEWSERIASLVQQDWKLIHVYLQWRVQLYRRLHADAPLPRQVILVQTTYVIPPPGRVISPWNWEQNVVLPIARWQPQAQWRGNLLPIEVYNPINHRFESVKRDDE